MAAADSCFPCLRLLALPQLAPRAWLPRHASEHNLRSLLAQMHLLVTVLCCSVQDMLDQVGVWVHACMCACTCAGTGGQQ